MAALLHESIQNGNYLTIKVIEFIKEQIATGKYNATALATFEDEIHPEISKLTK